MDILLQAFVLGAIGGFIPGAVLTMLLVSTLQGGLKGGLRTFVWAMLAELVIVGALLLVALQLPLQTSAFIVVGFVGSIVLLYFAWQVFKLRSIKVENGSVFFTPSKIFLLSVTNSPLYIFWTTICFPLIWRLGETWPLTIAALSFFVVFEIGWAIATVATVLIFAFSRKTLTNEKIMHKVFVAIALILGGFGVHMLLQSITYFL
jgi:threonine/homoserine/homoserine lactone efflux protein